MTDINDEEEEKPVDFFQERNIMGQPIPKIEELPPASEYIIKPKFDFEPAIPQDRLLAALIDSLSLGAVLMLLSSAIFSIQQVHDSNGIVSFTSILLQCLYHGFFDSSDLQGTPGKILMGIKITNLEGGKISFLRAVGRYLMQFISAIVVLLGYISIYFDENRQGWHDKAARTYVIRDNGIELATQQKKRKSGLIILILLAIVAYIIFTYQHDQYWDSNYWKPKHTRQNVKEKDNEEQKILAAISSSKLVKEDFTFTDTVNKFQILVKSKFQYSTTSPGCSLLVVDTTTGTTNLLYMVFKGHVNEGFTYGNFLKKTEELRPDEFSYSDIKLSDFMNGYKMEEGKLKCTRDQKIFYSIERIYIKDKTFYMLMLLNNNPGHTLNESDTTREIFNSFKILE